MFLNLGGIDGLFHFTNNHIKRQGEIDILEGVNDQGPNRASLHTSPGIRPLVLSFHRIMAYIKMNLRLGCQMPSERIQTGYTKFHDIKILGYQSYIYVKTERRAGLRCGSERKCGLFCGVSDRTKLRTAI